MRQQPTLDQLRREHADQLVEDRRAALHVDDGRDLISAGPHGLYTVATAPGAVTRWIEQGWAHPAGHGVHLPHRADVCEEAGGRPEEYAAVEGR
jgi:hypothetical protein